MSYDSTVVQRQLQAARASLPAQTFPTEQMSPALDALSLKFALHARASARTTLDIGCGDGLASAALLARGGYVLAVDPDPAALRTLLARVPSEQYRRLKVREGALPTIDFKLANFSAVHAARVLHLLEPETLQPTLRKFFRWLYPHGKLFISTLAPAGAFWNRFHAEYQRRAMGRERWPGYIDDPWQFFPHWNGSTCVHLLDEHTLTREVEAAGFAMEQCWSYALAWDAQQVCSACIARCA